MNYKSGSIYVMAFSAVSFIVGVILFYIGNDMISVTGYRTDTGISVERTHYKLYFIPINNETFDNVYKVKLKTAPNDEKKLVKSVLLVTAEGTRELIANNRKLDIQTKNELHNDLDFFIRRKKEYSKSYSFSDRTGLAGIIIVIFCLLSGFSALLTYINRILVEKDRNKEIMFQHDLLLGVLSGKYKTREKNKTLVSIDKFKSLKSDRIYAFAVPDRKKELSRTFKDIEVLDSPDPDNLVLSFSKLAGMKISMNGDVLIIPFSSSDIKESDLKLLLKEHRLRGNSCTILTGVPGDTTERAGCLKRNTVNKITAVTAEPENGTEFDLSVYCFQTGVLVKAAEVKKDSVRDIRELINFLIKEDHKIASVKVI